MFEKYLEQTIEIIYEDQKGKITQRKIHRSIVFGIRALGQHAWKQVNLVYLM